MKQGHLNDCINVCLVNAFSALMLLVGWKEWHLACKNWAMCCWRGYLSVARCRFAYGPADATATHCLLLQQNPHWFHLSGTGYQLTWVIPDKVQVGGGIKRLCVCVIDSVWHAYMLVVQHCYALICVSTQLVLDIWFTLDCGFTLFSLFLNICAYTCIHLFVSILPDFGGQCLCCHTCLVCYFVWLCHFTFSCLRQFFSYISRLTC